MIESDADNWGFRRAVLDTTRPLYQQIADIIRTRLIELGTERQGQALPTATALARRYGTSSDTVHRALHLLEGEGYVRGEPHRGYYFRGVTDE